MPPSKDPPPKDKDPQSKVKPPVIERPKNEDAKPEANRFAVVMLALLFAGAAVYIGSRILGA